MINPSLSSKLLFFFFSCMISKVICACEQQYHYSAIVQSHSVVKGAVFKQLSRFNSYITIKSMTLGNQTNWWGLKADKIDFKIDKQKVSDADYLPSFSFHLNELGLIDKFWFPKNVTKTQKNKLKPLAYLFQYRRSNKSSYISLETEQDGTYKYQYNVDGGKITRKKISVNLSGKDSVTDITIQDAADVITQGGCFLENSVGYEKIKVTSEFPQLNNYFNVHFELSTEPNLTDSPLLHLPENLNEWPVYHRPVLTHEEKTHQKRLLLTYVSHFDPRNESVFKLADELSQYPDELSALMTVLSDNQLSDAQNKRLIHALGVLDSPESQELLAQMITSTDLDSDSRFRALQAIAIGDSDISPSIVPAIENMLRSGLITDDRILKNSLLPTLGVMVGNRPETSAKTELLDVLSQELSSAQSDDRKLQLILALGNTGDTNYLQDITAYQDNNSSEIRRSVANALGHMSSEDAYLALDNMLGNESIQSTSVCQQIIKSLSDYSLKNDTMNRVSDIAERSENPELRESAVDLISRQTKEKRISVLKKLLKSEHNRHVFQAIINGIHSE